MKALTRFMVFVLVAMFVVPMVFAGGQREPAGRPAPAERQAGPQYGGELTVISLAASSEIVTLDLTAGNWGQWPYAAPYSQALVRGDHEKYGPAGTGENPFRDSHDGALQEYLRGELAESWEISDEKIVWHIRRGVMWAGNPRIGMAPRELTAHDLVATWENWLASPVGAGASGWFINGVYAEDDYTFVMEWDGYNYLWTSWGSGSIGARAVPPEVLAAGYSDWRNQVGTGPFMLTDYVAGSYVVYERNPNFWETTTIEGVEYELPFVDRVVYPIIPDESTRIATIRTGTADLMQSQPIVHWDSLARTAPDLILEEALGAVSHRHVSFQSNPEHGDLFVDNRELRRAIAIGTDQRAIGDAVYNGRYELWASWLPFGGMFHTAVEDMRESARVLFEYHPDRARQMLADAGYPDGLAFEMIIGSHPEDQDLAAMLKDQWSRIGIDLTIRGVENAVLSATGNRRVDYPEAILLTQGDSKRNMASYVTWYPVRSGLHDQVRDDMFLEIAATADLEEQAALVNEWTQYVLETADHLQLPAAYSMIAWWPWVKNYHGEQDMGFRYIGPALARLWIDQDMKREMGFR